MNDIQLEFHKETIRLWKNAVKLEHERIESLTCRKENKMKLYYGLEEQEHLMDTMSEVVESVIEDNCGVIGESFDTIADRLIWPIEVCEFIPDIPSVNTIESMIMDDILERLSEEYGDPDGDIEEPSDDMKTTLRPFAEAIIKDFPFWSCEPTGVIHHITKQLARRICDK